MQVDDVNSSAEPYARWPAHHPTSPVCAQRAARAHAWGRSARAALATSGGSPALLTSTTWSGDINGSVQWTHDNDFRIATETLVPGGNTITYAYDNDNLVTCASPGTCVPPSTDALQLTYSSTNGLLTQTTIGNLVETYTYNTFGELATHTAKYAGNTIYQGVFHSTAAPRDNLGRITRKVETVLGVTRTDDYQYDTRGRLLNVARDGDLVSVYEYDDNGNRLSLSNPTADTTTLGSYDDQDRVVTYGNFDYEFNENGDLVSKTDTVSGDTTTYEYDVRGSLLSVGMPDGTEIEYIIDGKGRRVGKKIDGVLVQGLVYKDDIRIGAELDGNGNVVSQFVYLDTNHSPDFMIRGGTVYRFLKDQVGSVRATVDVLTGTFAQELVLDELGNVLNDTNPGFQPFGLAGGLYDQDVRLLRFGARDYDPLIGRWTASDPIRFAAGSSNLYLYVNGDPINSADPSGLISGREIGCRIAAGAVGIGCTILCVPFGGPAACIVVCLGITAGINATVCAPPPPACYCTGPGAEPGTYVTEQMAPVPDGRGGYTCPPCPSPEEGDSCR